jgi:hypothetical protein
LYLEFSAVITTRSAAAIVAVSIYLMSCGERSPIQQANTSNPTANANANAVHTNPEELGVVVKLPYEPEDVVWKEVGPTKKITAIMRFKSADSQRVVADAQGFGASQPVSIPVDQWFPDELVAQGEMSGDNTLPGTAYPGNAFFQEPYTSGKIARVDGSDYFILELFAK